MRLILLLILLSSCQDFNSNSFDESLVDTVNIDTSTPGGKRLKDSYDILNDKCMNCHTGYHNSWLKYDTDNLWETNQVVIKGDAEASELIIRMKNRGGDMPLGGVQLTVDEFQVVSEWINNI
jgi:uncharacterized membrane protein